MFDITSIAQLLSLLGPATAQAGAPPGASQGPFSSPVPIGGWEESYKPDMGEASVAEQLRKFNVGSDVGERNIPPWPNKNYAVPSAPPAEVFGAVTPPDLPKASGVLSSPRTVSPTVDSANIDMDRFHQWYQGGVGRFGLHPNPYHADMNVNLPDIFAKGGVFTETPGPVPDVITTSDGKTIPITPAKMAMVKTSEQVNQERTGQAQAQAPQVAPLPPAAPATPSTALGQAPVLPTAAVQQAFTPTIVPAPQPGVAAGVSSPSEISPPAIQPGQPSVQPAPPVGNEFGGKALTLGGMIASAIDPKRFGPAGQMMSEFGQKEIGQVRADAAARLAGYPTAQALEAAKATAGIDKTRSETALEKVRAPYVETMTKELMAKIPGIQYHDALVKAQGDFQRMKVDYGRMMPPQLVTDQLTGKTVMVDGEHVFAGIQQSNHSLTQFIGTTAAAGHAKTLTDLDKQKLVNLAQNIPVTLADGTTVNYNVPQYLAAMSAKPEWIARNGAKWHLYQTVIAPINKAYENAYPGRSVVLDEGLKRSAAVAAAQFANDPDPVWRNYGLVLSGIAGIMPAPAGTTASQALRGGPVAPISPTSGSWGAAPPKR